MVTSPSSSLPYRTRLHYTELLQPHGSIRAGRSLPFHAITQLTRRRKDVQHDNQKAQNFKGPGRLSLCLNPGLDLFLCLVLDLLDLNPANMIPR